jgi:hypothetical protein
MRKNKFFMGALVMALAMILAACGGETKDVTVTIKNTSGSAITGVAVAVSAPPIGKGAYVVGSVSEFDKTITLVAGGQKELAPFTVFAVPFPILPLMFNVVVTKAPDGAGSPAQFITDKNSVSISYVIKQDIFSKAISPPSAVTFVYDGSALDLAP